MRATGFVPPARLAAAVARLLVASALACGGAPSVGARVEERASPAVWEDARRRGVEFRAVGNEPGWLLEVGGDRLRLVTDYGAHELLAPISARATEGGGARATLRAETATRSVVVVLEKGPCTDTMSGERFETSVRVAVDGTTLRGCGRRLD